MKITQIRTQPIEIPFDKPLGTSIHRITSVAALLVWIDTDEGITGESYLWVIGKHKLPVLMEMVRSLEPVVKHRNPLDVRHALTKCGTKLISLVIKALQFLE